MTARKTAGPEERLGGDRKINRPGDRLPLDRTTGMVVARAFTAWWTGVRFPPAPQKFWRVRPTEVSDTDHVTWHRRNGLAVSQLSVRGSSMAAPMDHIVDTVGDKLAPLCATHSRNTC
jgi:hypothetical protein